MADREITVLQKSTKLFETLDETSRARVLEFLRDRFGGDSLKRVDAAVSLTRIQPAINSTDGQIPGIAMRDPEGKIKITARDLKAKSANDAAVRLVHILILAHKQLVGDSWVSGKSIIVPVLKHWRCYDGNTRMAIRSNKGIVRNGDKLSLDIHAEQEAQNFINQILDEKLKGSWSPNGKKRAVKSDA